MQNQGKFVYLVELAVPNMLFSFLHFLTILVYVTTSPTRMKYLHARDGSFYLLKAQLIFFFIVCVFEFTVNLPRCAAALQGPTSAFMEWENERD